MQLGDTPTDVNALVLDKKSIEIVASEDGASPLSFVLPPYEDIAEVKGLQRGHFSVKELSVTVQAPIWAMLAIERARLERKFDKFVDSPTYLNRLANLASIAGDLDEEARHLHEAARFTQDEFISDSLIDNLSARHREVEAEEALLQRDLATSVYANLRLAAMYAKREKIPLASDRVTAALKIDPLDFGARLFDGALKLWNGDWAGAILSFRVASEGRPNSAAVHTNLAVAYVRLNRDDKALQSLKVAVAIDPLNVNAVTLLADVAHARGKNEDAVPSLRYFLRYEQKNPTLWGRLARALLKLGQTNEAIAATKRQASLEDDGAVWNNLGVAYFSKGDFQKSLESFKHAMLLCQKTTDYGFCLAARNAAAVIGRAYRPDEVAKFVDEVVRPENRDLFAARTDLSSIFISKLQSLIRARRISEAAEYGEELLGWASASSEVSLRAATALLSLYSLNEGGAARALQIAEAFAENALHARIQNDEIRWQLVNNLAFVFAEHGMFDRAEKYLQNISAIIHKSPYPTATSGLLHLKKGHVTRAEALYGEALRLCVNVEDKARIRQKWNFEIGKALMVDEPRRALRYLTKAKEEAGAEPWLSKQAAKLIVALPR